MDSIQELFEAGLREVYSAEKAVLAILPKMFDKASSAELRLALEAHTSETRQHIERLDQVFARIDCSPELRNSPAFTGLMQEAEALMAGTSDPDVLDAGLIGCAKAIEHFEMARYATLIAWAERLDMIEIADILEHSLEEEETADVRLAELALDTLNQAGAIQPGTH
jgi:ferritin-like metal-binding protein YciE